MGFYESEAPLLGPMLLQARLNMGRDRGLRVVPRSLPYFHVPHLKYPLSDLRPMTPIKIELPSAHLERTDPVRFNYEFTNALVRLNRILDNEH